MTKKHWRDLERRERLDVERLQQDVTEAKKVKTEKGVGDKLYRYWVLAGLRQSKENLEKDFDKQDSNYQEYKRQVRYLRKQIFLHYLKNRCVKSYPDL